MANKRMLLLVYLSMVVLLSVATAWGAGGLTQISDGVYAYTNIKSQSPGNRFGANAGIVIGDDGLLVVDTLTTAKEAALFLADIRKITDKPVRYVINTHYHLDHAFGNCVFADAGAIIICHTACRRQILRIKDQALETARSSGFDDAALEGTRIVVPSMAFEQTLELDLGHRVVQLLYSGHPSHTAGSIFVWIPGQKVVFAGDALFNDFHPYLAEGDLKGWSKTLDKLLGLGAEKIIPGHGPLSGPNAVQEMKSYLRVFDREARKLCAASSDADQIAARMIKRLPPRADGDFLIKANIQGRYLSPTDRKAK